MSRKFWQTQKFKELENKWHEILERSGFKDAEKKVNGVFTLRQKATNCYRHASAVARENKLRYYELLGIHYHQEEFTDKVEKLVMERRASGVKIKKVCEELKELNERCHRETVRYIIRRYERKWGIKK